MDFAGTTFDTGKPDTTGWIPGFGAHNLISDLTDALRQANAADQIVVQSPTFQTLTTDIISAVFQFYSRGLAEMGSQASDIWVTRDHAGNYLLSGDSEVGQRAQRLNQLSSALDDVVRTSGGQFTTNGVAFIIEGAQRPVNILIAQQVENVLMRQLPEIAHFDQRDRLVEDLPDGITLQGLEADSPLLRAFLEVVDGDSVRRFLIKHDPDDRDQLLREMQDRINLVVDEVNHAVRKGGGQQADLLTIRLAARGDSLQIATKTTLKPSYYRQISENTKLLFAYYLLLRARHIEADILLFDEPNNGFHATAQEELCASWRC